MKKKLFFFASIFILGCAITPKQATLSDGSQGFSVSCNGSAINWSRCYEAAKTVCPNGFDVKDREQYLLEYDLPIRILYFKCK